MSVGCYVIIYPPISCTVRTALCQSGWIFAQSFWYIANPKVVSRSHFHIKRSLISQHSHHSQQVCVTVMIVWLRCLINSFGERRGNCAFYCICRHDNVCLQMNLGAIGFASSVWDHSLLLWAHNPNPFKVGAIGVALSVWDHSLLLPVHKLRYIEC